MGHLLVLESKSAAIAVLTYSLPQWQLVHMDRWSAPLCNVTTPILTYFCGVCQCICMCTYLYVNKLACLYLLLFGWVCVCSCMCATTFVCVYLHAGPLHLPCTAAKPPTLCKAFTMNGLYSWKIFFCPNGLVLTDEKGISIHLIGGSLLFFFYLFS